MICSPGMAIAKVGTFGHGVAASPSAGIGASVSLHNFNNSRAQFHQQQSNLFRQSSSSHTEYAYTGIKSTSASAALHDDTDSVAAAPRLLRYGVVCLHFTAVLAHASPDGDA